MYSEVTFFSLLSAQVAFRCYANSSRWRHLADDAKQKNDHLACHSKTDTTKIMSNN